MQDKGVLDMWGRGSGGGSCQPAQRSAQAGAAGKFSCRERVANTHGTQRWRLPATGRAANLEAGAGEKWGLMYMRRGAAERARQAGG